MLVSVVQQSDSAVLLFSCYDVSDSLRLHGLQHMRFPPPPLSPGVCSDSCPLSWWCHLTIPSPATPFSFCLHSLPAWGSFPVNQLFTSSGQITGETYICICIHIPPSLLNCYHLTPLGHHRAVSWAPVLSRRFLQATCFTQGSVLVSGEGNGKPVQYSCL